MQGLDSTITNVALPYMQAGLMAGSDQITWVLTSYVIAAAVMTAPVGWLAARLGRRRLFITCLAGFTLASMLCGAAQTLGQMVAFRLLQGIFGAAFVPLSQATMLDTFPMERRAEAMAVWGIGVMVGPVLGPVLGGWLTGLGDWRWVFYVNLPVGVLAMLGLVAVMPPDRPDPARGFDWTGFLALALGIGALQLLLDRGEGLDWFAAPEIMAEAMLAVLGFYLFGVHMLTAPRPFLPPAMFRDTNLVMALLATFLNGTVLLASTALLAGYLQKLAGYPVEAAGLAMMPRGLGTMAGMLLAGWLGRRVDQRRLMALGVLLLAWSVHEMSQWTPEIEGTRLAATLALQGFATGLSSNPLSVLAYATLAPHWRGDAAGLIALFRNTGNAVGVSVTAVVLARMAQVSHAELAAHVTPFNRLLQDGSATARLLGPGSATGPWLLEGMIGHAAAVIAASDTWRLLTVAALLPLPLIALMRRPGS
ncbi:DHA2 family efflux MFS transporter permease subunit [Rhodovastum atsumiense]|uniref:DHA2 family efflux MFS transporter permease subunit n=2 Tax=Rhodovastum atsumiense TaxID=504468 RepID=A0A5M6IP85_9PROT|nr:DHA2 family efflux MFS transporter permease subunit [Rhodovastum atsumiense]